MDVLAREPEEIGIPGYFNKPELIHAENIFQDFWETCVRLKVYGVPAPYSLKRTWHKGTGMLYVIL